MKLVLRRLVKGDTDYELVFGVLFLPALAAVLYVLSRLPSFLLPRCMLHDRFGIPCPTCGASRSIHLLTGGHLVDAWFMQPLLVTLAAVAAAYSAYSFVVVSGKLPRLRLAGVSVGNQRLLALGAVVLVLVNWLYLLRHGV